MFGPSTFGQVPDDAPPREAPRNDWHRDAYDERVVIGGTDMPFGEMVKTAFMWLLAITIASIPFDLAALVIYSLIA